ncbi:MAG TPA: DinB family protein [Fimbriimonadaceae bacterium]|nr:DinB family protein [Fimbriimonadaceae bacterium]
MTISELIRMECDSVGVKVRKTLEGMEEAHYGFKVTPQAMTPAETLEHLAECYVAFQKIASGEQHDWGSYSAPDKSPAALMANWEAERAKAVAFALSDDSHAEHAHDFISAHDHYHVGQLALIRMAVDPSWDPYSIYQAG